MNWFFVDFDKIIDFLRFTIKPILTIRYVPINFKLFGVLENMKGKKLMKFSIFWVLSLTKQNVERL